MVLFLLMAIFILDPAGRHFIFDNFCWWRF